MQPNTEPPKKFKGMPLKIQKHSDTEIEILWNNGEKTVLPYLELRFQCRCAECVDEWTRERRVQKDALPASIKPIKVETVGRYAIQVEWNDGHRTGIYPYELLYHLGHAKPDSNLD